MYTITCDGNLLYDPRVDELKVANAKLQLEVNRSGSFDFTIYPAHPLYGTIQKLKSVIEVYQDGLLLFRGRVLNDRTGLFLNKEIECEGDLAFFNDTIMRPFEYTGNLVGFIQLIIDSHNAQAGADKQFTRGNVTVTDPNDFITRSSIDYQTSWEVIENRLIKNLGGYIMVRRSGGVNYIDYLADSTTQSLQELKLEENILDIIKDTRSDTIITALIPLGAKLTDENGNETDQRLTISSVNGGLDYVHDAAAVTQYGWIFGTKTWDAVTDANNLLTRANQELAVRINLGVSVEIKAIDLSMIDTNIDEIRVFEYVQVTSEPHGINAMALITKLSINILDPKQNTFTLGFSYDTFTEKQVLSDKAIRQIQSDYVTNQSIQEVRSSLQTVSSTITQQAEQIALKADQTTVDTVSTVANSKAKVFLSTPTTPYYVGDIWIETNATTGGNKVCTTERLTGAYVAGDWTKEGVTSRMDSAEQKITPTAITSTVRSSTEYINDLGGKVDNSTLTNYSTINQTADSIDLLFKKSGMQNMFVNSDMSLGLENFVFYHQTGGSNALSIRADYWGGYENTFEIFQSTAHVTTTALSYLYNLVPGSVYTVGCLVAGHRANNQILVINWADTQIVGISEVVSEGYGGDNLSNWKTISVTFTATDATMRLRHYSISTGAGGFYWAKHFQLNPGNTLSPYSKRQGEFKTAKYTFDGESAKFYDADFELWRGGVRKLYFDTVNNRYIFKGQVEADSGLIGRFAISGQDLVYTSELFEKDYDWSDYTKLHRLVLGLDTPTAYDYAVYDFYEPGVNHFSIADMVLLHRYLEGIDPKPIRLVRSVVRIGTNNGAITTQAVAENGSAGPTTTIRSEKVSSDLINANLIGAQTCEFTKIQVYKV